jgi:hypothetical protein
MRGESPIAVVTAALPRLEPLQYVRTNVLEIAYVEAGPGDGEVTLLLHGFPYDIHTYVDVIPLLVEAGHRVIVPYLRGHGPTRFLDSAIPRSGQQASIGADVIALLAMIGVGVQLASPLRCGQNVVPASSPSTVILSRISVAPCFRFGPISKLASGISTIS